MTYLLILFGIIIFHPAPSPLWCDVAKPIYIRTDDLAFLQGKPSGLKTSEWIRVHNQMIIDLCHFIPSYPNDQR